MPNFHFGGLPLGCNIHLNHWLAFYCIWWERTDLLNVTKSFSSNFSCSHLAGLTGHCLPIAHPLHMGCSLPMNYYEANEIWKGHLLLWLPAVRVHCLAYILDNPRGLSLCSSCHSSLPFTYSTAQGKLKSLQRFIRERTQDYRRVSTNFQLELETQRLIRTKHVCKWRRKASGDVLTGKTHHNQLKKGSSFSVPVDCSYVEMSLFFKGG